VKDLVKAVDPPDSEEVTRDAIAYLEALGIAGRNATNEHGVEHQAFSCGCSVYPGLVVPCARHERALIA
jgi:hypothetical protein